MADLRMTLGVSAVVGLSAAGCGDDSIPSSTGPSASSEGGETSEPPSPSGSGPTAGGSGTGVETPALDDTGPTAADSTGPGSTGPGSTCGDGVLDEQEVCDGEAHGGQSCRSRGYDAGTLACADDCAAFDESGCVSFSCGNGMLEGREACDGPALGGATCASEGFDSGSLSCDERCQLDTSDCATCGNVIVEGDEACDGVALLGQTCELQGFDSGQLACAADCMGFDLAGCGQCGNAIIDGDELCDAQVLGGATCASQGFDSGQLACMANCAGFDPSGCGQCGNAIIDGDELCDGPATGGATCVSEGFDSGLLSCVAGTCDDYDTSGCGICGNGIVDGYEDCDDGNDIDDDACPNDCGGEERIIFVTSEMFNGDMGGLVGADGQCQALAAAAGLPGTFLAWLSTDDESPATRMTPSELPYVRPDGVQIAPNWAGLIDGDLDAPIMITETGGMVPVGNTNCSGGGFPTVWSRTNIDGTAQPDSCENWTSTAGGGRWGRATDVDQLWTTWCVGGSCEWVSPIYCVQQ